MEEIPRSGDDFVGCHALEQLLPSATDNSAVIPEAACVRAKARTGAAIRDPYPL
jgi:hypothetical protein